MSSVVVALQGWNSSTQGWNTGAWNADVAITTGATGAVGATTASGKADISVTGLAGTGAVGSTTVTGAASVSVTGVSGTGELGFIQQPWGLIIPSQTPSWTTIAA